MKQFKLHLQPPEDIAAHWAKITAWKAENDKLIEVLTTKMDLYHDPFLAGTVLEEMYHENEIKDLCLQAYGSDWPSQVTKIAKLKLIGNGDCPECGCDRADGIPGPLVRDDLDRLCQEITGFKCQNCQTEYDLEPEDQ